MSGIYIHIPYCRQACSYCDFYFSTNLSTKNKLVDALLQEIVLRRHETTANIGTIYFGGGTPSLLSIEEMEQVLFAIHKNHTVDAGAEITLEANPDNLTEEYLTGLKNAGVNRLSIGLQSFNEQELKELNRAHNAVQNITVVKKAQAMGFDNISVDLIYGTPWLTAEGWENHLQKVIDLNVQHISCYQLTIEEKTELHHRLQKGQVNEPDDELTEQQFLVLIETLKQAGFVHYEVSNFGKPGFFSRHNTSYWKDIPYMGLGPSAHGYDGVNRYANVRNLHTYIKQTEQGSGWYEVEERNEKNIYNDLVLTGLRTIFGVDLVLIEKKLNQSYVNYFQRKAQKYLENGQMVKENYVYTLREEAFLFADRISQDLFWI